MLRRILTTPEGNAGTDAKRADGKGSSSSYPNKAASVSLLFVGELRPTATMRSRRHGLRERTVTLHKIAGSASIVPDQKTKNQSEGVTPIAAGGHWSLLEEDDISWRGKWSPRREMCFATNLFWSGSFNGRSSPFQSLLSFFRLSSHRVLHSSRVISTVPTQEAAMNHITDQ